MARPDTNRPKVTSNEVVTFERNTAHADVKIVAGVKPLNVRGMRTNLSTTIGLEAPIKSLYIGSRSSLVRVEPWRNDFQYFRERRLLLDAYSTKAENVGDDGSGSFL